MYYNNIILSIWYNITRHSYYIDNRYIKLLEDQLAHINEFFHHLSCRLCLQYVYVILCVTVKIVYNFL